MKNLAFVVFYLFLASCAPISMNRSYLSEMEDHQEQGLFVPSKSFQTVAGDTGFDGYSKEDMLKRTPIKSEDRPQWTEAQNTKKDLNRKLAHLSEPQKNWFIRNDHLFPTDSNKIYFLSLSPDEREEYLGMISSKYVEKTAERKPASHFKYSPRKSKTVSLGMEKDEVSNVWGRPHRVDVAGNPRNGNERWTFFEGTTRRFVYFAEGRVEGWVTE